MKITYVKSESTVKPDVVSIEKTTVYLRRNIVEETRTSEDGTVSVFYVYEEAKLSHEEFSKYSNEIVITRLVENGSNNADNQLILMEAIADLYDIIASTK